jgi:hypothetical protein
MWPHQRFLSVKSFCPGVCCIEAKQKRMPKILLKSTNGKSPVVSSGSAYSAYPTNITAETSSSYTSQSWSEPLGISFKICQISGLPLDRIENIPV